jgi:hypothetical protein
MRAELLTFRPFQGTWETLSRSDGDTPFCYDALGSLSAMDL